MQSKAIQQYLNTYAETETTVTDELFSPLPQDIQFARCVVIPVFAESHHFVERWLHGKLAENNLLILVVNQHENADEQQQDQNAELFDWLLEHSDVTFNHRHLYLLQIQEHFILMVDRFRHTLKLEEKLGVGHARKIGCDIATQLIKTQRVHMPWIYCTDADACLPDNYFSHIDDSNQQPSLAAKVFDFKHIAANEDEANGTMFTSTQLYEHAIKYYRNGLSWAGSPYAFYTLGSTLAMSATAYCQVRGFPKRAGAEDFYLLNKLAKVGKVENNEDICIELDARLSNRVPFGTGPAVEKIMQRIAQNQPYTYYDPKCFSVLKAMYDDLPLILSKVLTNGSPYWSQSDSDGTFAENDRSGQHLASQYESALRDLDIGKFCLHAQKQCRDKAAVIQQFHQWFDAFLTLKFIRYLQQHFYPAINIDHCLEHFKQISA